MIHGEKISLRKFTKNDVEPMLANWNSYELRQYLPSPLPSSAADLERFVEAKDSAAQARSEFCFAIDSIADKSLVGLASLDNISWMSRHAFVGQLAIFDPTQRGKGYGREALLRLLDFGFHSLDLHVIVLWVEADNNSAIQLYENIGFRKGGHMRELAFRNGARRDVLSMDILAWEFRERHGVLPK